MNSAMCEKTREHDAILALERVILRLFWVYIHVQGT